MATLGTTSEGLDKAITERVDKAKAAQASGDTKECIAITSQVLERMEKPRKAVAPAAAAAPDAQSAQLSTPGVQTRILHPRVERHVS